MQNEHEMLGEIIKNARMKADITVEDLASQGRSRREIYISYRERRQKAQLRHPVQADSGAVHFTRSDFLPGKED